MSEKKPHGVQLLIRAVVKDPDGKIIHDTGQKPSKSFVIQFLEVVYGIFNALAVGGYEITATDGTEDYVYVHDQNCNQHFIVDAGVNVSTHGIVVGTGDTAETNTDYKLQTQLTEGVGAGNITHGAMTVGAVAVVGANVDLELKRSFTNNTGSTITVKEAGIYIFLNYSTLFYHCIIRDVLVSPIDVPDKCTLTVYYTLRTTV